VRKEALARVKADEQGVGIGLKFLMSESTISSYLISTEGSITTNKPSPETCK
jgi:hypothetical protein